MVVAAAEFLQGVQGSPGLDVPGGPGLSQIVPPEVGNPRALQRRPPGPGVDLGEAVALAGEHVDRVFVPWMESCYQAAAEGAFLVIP